MTEYETILVERRERVGIITLNRPQAHQDGEADVGYPISTHRYVAGILSCHSVQERFVSAVRSRCKPSTAAKLAMTLTGFIDAPFGRQSSGAAV